MTTVHILQCREHGGRFQKPAGRRGRNPVKCNPDEGWGCSAVETAIEKPKRRSKRPIEVMEDVPTKPQYVKNHEAVSGLTVSPAPARKLPQGAQASKAARDAATATLEGLGWITSGKGWKEIDNYHASITANRGPETLYLEWRNGTNIENDYAILDTETASDNGGMPATNLPFDPETVSDGELVQYISGSKISWWNRVGGMVESGVCGDPTAENGVRVSIEHVYSGIAGPAGVDRLIKFNLMESGTRVIKVGALVKVG